MADLSTDVRYVKGIGEQRAKALGKLGIATLRDLISYFPRAYEDRRTFKRVIDLQPGENACVRAMVAAEPTLSRIRKGLELVKLRAVDDSSACCKLQIITSYDAVNITSADSSWGFLCDTAWSHCTDTAANAFFIKFTMGGLVLYTSLPGISAYFCTCLQQSRSSSFKFFYCS